MTQYEVEQIIEGIWADLVDRKGVGDELECCDEDTQEEIKDSWRTIIYKAMGGDE